MSAECSCVHEHDHGSGCGCGHAHAADKRSWWRLLSCAAVFFAGLTVTSVLSLPPFVQPLWLGAAMMPLLWPLLREAWEELRAWAIGENTLLVLAVFAAFILGEWVEGSMVLLLFVLGESIEHRAVAYSRRAIASLAAMTPDTALRVEKNGDTAVIPATQVAMGDILRIPPHSRVPVDCRVLVGESDVNTAALTGESLPVYCSVGSELLSGSVNGAGELTVEALRVNDESAAARILHLVEDAAAQKGASERFITRLARVYTPAVMLGAVIVAVLPPLFGGVWSVWIYRALALLVAACPCALVISVPLGFYAGIAAAARQGVLIKGGSFVEKLARVRVVAFDKTGTLTADVLHLDEVIVRGVTRDKALCIAAALETHSAHPAAKALCAAVSDELPAVADLRELPGLGVCATVEGHAYACGGARLMQRLDVSIERYPPAAAYLACDGVAVAAFMLSSALQDGATTAVTLLRKMGVSHLAMLTGDRMAAAQRVADAVGITDVRAELLPEDKLAAVRERQAAGFETAFIGDGINDAPVLAAADVGIAMGLGSPAAIETADVVLVAGGLSRLPTAVRLCRRMVCRVWGNIAFSLGVKAVVLTLAVLGIAPMWLAVFADVGVCILCVLNALRLLWRQRN